MVTKYPYIRKKGLFVNQTKHFLDLKAYSTVSNNEPARM
jgi:hypothetical protein